MRDETTTTRTPPDATAAARHVLRRWSATVLARLDAVVEEHSGAPSARDAALRVVADTARERRTDLAVLVPLLEDPVVAPAWRRHCRDVALAAGEDVTQEVTRLLEEAVGRSERVRVVEPRPEHATGCRVLALARRSLRLAS